MRLRPNSPITQLGRLSTAGIAVLALASSAWAAAPYFSGPSIVKVAAPTVYTGRGFAPNAAVTVIITTPQDGNAASYGAVAGPDGTLSYEVRPRVAGPHLVTVTDSGGRTIVTLNFTAMN